MHEKPLYNALDQQPAFALRYTWSGWVSKGNLQALPESSWTDLAELWEKDGLRLLERAIQPDSALLTFSTTPAVSPVFLAARAKGRLQHAFRTGRSGPVDFSRKVAVRSIGENTSDCILAYIHSQVPNEEFVDPRFAEFLEQVMPDHLHVALRANNEHSPAEVVLAFQNNLAFMLRKGAIWRPGYYVGTFGEYNMNAIRRAGRLESASPAGQAGRGRPRSGDLV